MVMLVEFMRPKRGLCVARGDWEMCAHGVAIMGFCVIRTKMSRGKNEATKGGCTKRGNKGWTGTLETIGKGELIADIWGKRGSTYGKTGVCRRIQTKGGRERLVRTLNVCEFELTHRGLHGKLLVLLVTMLNVIELSLTGLTRGIAADGALYVTAFKLVQTRRGLALAAHTEAHLEGLI